MNPSAREVKQIMAALLQVAPEAIADTTRPADIPRWDSLQHMILVASLEEEFGIDIEPQEAVEMYKDFHALSSMIARKTARG